MNSLDASSHARSAVTVIAVSAALSGCYYYVPYGYVPYGEVATQPYPFTMPNAAAPGTAAGVTASTNTYIAAAAPVFVEPAYYQGRSIKFSAVA